MCRAADRLPYLCTALHLTPQDFATALDLPLRRATRILRSTRPPSLGLVARVLRSFPQLSPEWLVSGEGEIFRLTSSNHVGTNYGTISQVIHACSCAGTIDALQAHLVEKERTIQLLLTRPALPLAA